jgi:hypothetical protein
MSETVLMRIAIFFIPNREAWFLKKILPGNSMMTNLELFAGESFRVTGLWMSSFCKSKGDMSVWQA